MVLVSFGLSPGAPGVYLCWLRVPSGEFEASCSCAGCVDLRRPLFYISMYKQAVLFVCAGCVDLCPIALQGEATASDLCAGCADPLASVFFFFFIFVYTYVAYLLCAGCGDLGLVSFWVSPRDCPRTIASSRLSWARLLCWARLGVLGSSESLGSPRLS